ncbi:MAG: outer membrane beta-barrel protein [Bacteroidetes bacterium]|nr:outer membrane beta-barrel protein [Bacteroidota bacterium]
MKKIIYVFIFMLMITGLSQAQTSKIVKTPFTPTFQVIVKGAYSVPLSHQDFKDFTSGFPGAQLELAYDFNPCWAVYGNFSADFISAKDFPVTTGGVTSDLKTSTQLSGSIGPRYYFNLRSAPLWKIYTDVGVGIYSVKRGDNTETSSQGTVTVTQDAFSQVGLNLGAGANVVVGSKMVVTMGAKYHFIMKKSAYSQTGTISDGTTSLPYNSPAADVPERSYLQFSLGLGFRL